MISVRDFGLPDFRSAGSAGSRSIDARDFGLKDYRFSVKSTSLARSSYGPKGLEDSAKGFNPGNLQNVWFALKGRERRGYQMNLAPIAAQELERTTETCYFVPGYYRVVPPGQADSHVRQIRMNDQSKLGAIFTLSG